jgi:hypothetical protein
VPLLPSRAGQEVIWPNRRLAPRREEPAVRGRDVEVTIANRCRGPCSNAIAGLRPYAESTTEAEVATAATEAAKPTPTEIASKAAAAKIAAAEAAATEVAATEVPTKAAAADVAAEAAKLRAC